MGIVLDIIIVLLLGLTIAFCWRLNQRINELKQSRKDLVELVRTFDTAIINTHKSIANLKEASYNAANELKGYITKAEELINDMSFMTDAAAKLADRLEGNIEKARDAEQVLNVIKKIENFTVKSTKKEKNKVSQEKVKSPVIVKSKSKDKNINSITVDKDLEPDKKKYTQKNKLTTQTLSNSTSSAEKKLVKAKL